MVDIYSLGKGTCAVVFKGAHLVTKTSVAAKCISLKESRDEYLRLLQEVATLKTLTVANPEHYNILKVGNKFKKKKRKQTRKKTY